MRTIKAQGGQYTGPFSWENRAFTVSELKRLQTFPDSYEIVGGRQVCIEQIGNSVPPQLGRILAISILDQVMGVSFPFQMHYLAENKILGFRQRKRELTKAYSIKARKALVDMQNSANIIHSNQRTETLLQNDYRFLGKNFSWTSDRVPDSSQFCVNFSASDNLWQISVLKDSYIHKNQGDEKCHIEVNSSDHTQWPLRVKLVRLSTNCFDSETFTALWKFFEEQVLKITGIADLVQLSGYYQYQPKIKAKAYMPEDLEKIPFWQIVKFVTEGVGVGKQVSSEDLSILWNCDPRKLLDYLLILRSMGFEVRSHKTNSQIAPGDYLIPYIFPTFTPRSVQLRKSLRERHV